MLVPTKYSFDILNSAIVFPESGRLIYSVWTITIFF